ncbi:acyltransferase [Dissulfurirhabdus thermomarina]|uniref:Acyltransferase n=1 Tax=Dissulfurirhabdus thermomarina TaxID=1765737 RepID=A0A6N9TRG6_DISTH|nr:acyltransferase [Dissulfurirhabdus thermomarina]NDY42027.1 acyltransferase [Dissulfurirhabdus thermomarina]NMX23052.1 acyltransferase [Dissulfurirhabdus thermomarina]
MSLNLKKIIRGFLDTLRRLYLRRVFGSVGPGSRVERWENLAKPRAIHIGSRVTIRRNARLEAVGPWDGATPRIRIGDGTVIMSHFHCGAAASVTIGRNVGIAERVLVTDHDHVFDHPHLPPALCPDLKAAPVVIGDGALIGAGCAVLKGVTIGERAVVGANAVVTRDVPPYTVVAGNPAREIRRFRPRAQAGAADTPPPA